MDYTAIYQYFSFAIFVLFSFISILLLIHKNKIQLHYFLAGLFIAGAYNVIYIWAYGSGLLKYARILLNTEISMAFLIGPFLYMYFSALTGHKKFRASRILCHILPAVVSIILLTVINIRDISIYTNYIDNGGAVPKYDSNRLVYIINTVCDCSMMLYFIISISKTSVLIKMRKISSEAKSILFFTVFFILGALLLVLSNLLKFELLGLSGIIILSIIPVYYIIFSFRYPDYADSIVKKARDITYRDTIAKRFDISLVKARIETLMDEEKIYNDPELSLNALSDLLLISPHELSFILNNTFEKNFNAFINSYRIRDVRKKLISDTDKSIVEIAFSVGFNSMSSFYDYFKKETAVSPKEYRNRHKEKDPVL